MKDYLFIGSTEPHREPLGGMMRKFFILSCVILTLMLSACASAGKEMSQSQLNRIKPHTTTKAEMFAIFGAPMSQGYDGSGNMVMMWNYVHVGPFGDMRQQILSVLINNDDLVEKYTVTDNKDAGVRMGK